MKKINILTAGLISPNSYGFLFPIIGNKKKLMDYKISFNIFYKIQPEIYDCDILIIDSKYFTNLWDKNKELIFEELIKFKSRVDKVFYFSINDSSTFDHALMIPYVDRYFKNQILKDKNLYLNSFYGNRYYTDYYHKNFEINDENPKNSTPIKNYEDLAKIKLGWNTGLVNWSTFSTIKYNLFSNLKINYSINSLGKFISPYRKRKNKISVRFNTDYSSKTVSYQRLQIKNKLNLYYNTNKINRFSYFRELKNSKIVISPFGLGEITLKDFEVFLTGGLLLKPFMQHMKTWPNLFIENETFIPYSLDLNDFNEVIDYSLSNYKKLIDIAVNGQELYKKYNIYDKENYKFCDYFSNLVKF